MAADGRAPGVVVRGVGEAKPAGRIEQPVTRERVPQGRVVVGTLGAEIETPVLADAIGAKGTQRGRLQV